MKWHNRLAGPTPTEVLDCTRSRGIPDKLTVETLRIACRREGLTCSDDLTQLPDILLINQDKNYHARVRYTYPLVAQELITPPTEPSYFKILWDYMEQQRAVTPCFTEHRPTATELSEAIKETKVAVQFTTVRYTKKDHRILSYERVAGREGPVHDIKTYELYKDVAFDNQGIFSPAITQEEYNRPIRI